MIVKLHRTSARRLPPGFTLEVCLFALECELQGNGASLLRLAAVRQIALAHGNTDRARELETQMIALLPSKG